MQTFILNKCNICFFLNILTYCSIYIFSINADNKNTFIQYVYHNFKIFIYTFTTTFRDKNYALLSVFYLVIYYFRVHSLMESDKSFCG